MNIYIYIHIYIYKYVRMHIIPLALYQSIDLSIDPSICIYAQLCTLARCDLQHYTCNQDA